MILKVKDIFQFVVMTVMSKAIMKECFDGLNIGIVIDL